MCCPVAGHAHKSLHALLLSNLPLRRVCTLRSLQSSPQNVVLDN